MQVGQVYILFVQMQREFVDIEQLGVSLPFDVHLGLDVRYGGIGVIKYFTGHHSVRQVGEIAGENPAIQYFYTR